MHGFIKQRLVNYGKRLLPQDLEIMELERELKIPIWGNCVGLVMNTKIQANH